MGLGQVYLIRTECYRFRGSLFRGFETPTGDFEKRVDLRVALLIRDCHLEVVPDVQPISIRHRSQLIRREVLKQASGLKIMRLIHFWPKNTAICYIAC